MSTEAGQQTPTSEPPAGGEPPNVPRRWHDTFIGWLPDWAAHDIREMSDAPRAIVALLILGFLGGAWAGNLFYSQEIRNLVSQIGGLNTQIEGLDRQLQALKPPAPRTVELEMACEQRTIGAITFNDRVTVLAVNASGASVFEQRWGEFVDPPSKLSSRYRCEIVNRGTMTVHNAWFDVDFVLKEVLRSEDGKTRGSGEILGSHNRSLMLPGAVEANGGRRVFWVWQDVTDVFADVRFREAVFVTDPDGRSGRVPIRMSGVVAMTLVPRDAK